MALIKSVRGFTPEIGEKLLPRRQRNYYRRCKNRKMIAVYGLAPYCAVTSILIRIGNGVNIQDGSVLHTLYQKSVIEIGDHVSVGHNVTIHGATIKDYALVGMGSTILDHAIVGEGAIVAARFFSPK